MFHQPSDFPFVPTLEASCGEILEELRALPAAAFGPSADSLTTVSGDFDETGWLYFDLLGGESALANQERCPATTRACTGVPGVRNAGFSLLRPGTHLYPHRGELPGVLRCHLPLLVPRGDLGLRFGDEVRTWEPCRCLIFDDSFEHEAWNRGDGDRVVLLITFSPRAGPPAGPNELRSLGGSGPAL